MSDNEKKFKSVLRTEIEAYLMFRKSQGHNEQKERIIFLTLDRFIQGTPKSSDEVNLSPEIIAGWLRSLPEQLGVNSRNLYISHYTQFARYLRSKGTDAFIPERSLPDLSYVPYIFSKEELDAMVMAADKRLDAARSPMDRNRACFSVLLRMLAGCGFRINELLNLKTSDVDLSHRLVTVRNSKGKKDRIVPVHDTLMDTLLAYVSSGIPQTEGYFFPSDKGKKLSYSWARDNFNKCLADIGIVKPELKPHARNICIHCIRHSYAVAAFQKLDHEGKDLYDEAPILSTYLGHKNIKGTEKYLHMTAANGTDILRRVADCNQGMFPEVGL